MRHEEQKIRKYIVDNNLPKPPSSTILNDDCIKRFGWEDSIIGELYRRLDGRLDGGAYTRIKNSKLKMQVGVVYRLIGYNKNGTALFFNGEAYVEPNRERMQFLIKKKKKSKKYNTEENKRLSQLINVDDDDVKINDLFECIEDSYSFKKGKVYLVEKIKKSKYSDKRFAIFTNRNNMKSKAFYSRMKKINTLFPELNKQTYNTINHIETKEECIFCKNTGIKKQGYDFGKPCNCEYGKKIKLDNVNEEVKEKLSNTMLFLRDEPANYVRKPEFDEYGNLKSRI